MSAIIKVEKRYRAVSLVLAVGVSLLWIAVMSRLVYDKVVLEGRARSRVDYSQLFRRERFRDFAYMEIYLEDKYLGFTKTVIHEAEGGAKLIIGETHINVRAPLLSGAFSMESRIHISAAEKLDRFTLTLELPVKDMDAVVVEGIAEGDRINVTIPAFGYAESVPLGNGMISSGISPFSDVVSITVGQEWDVNIFDPLQRTIRPVHVRVAGEEQFTWFGQQETVYRLESRDQSGTLLATAWVDQYGKVLEQTVNLFGMNLRMQAHD